MTTKLSTRRVSKTFTRKGDPLLALDEVDLDIQAGEFVSLIGASGCGKTTLLRIMHGLISPTSGEVLVDGQAVRKPSRTRGFVLQSDSLLPWRNVQDNVALGLELEHRSRSEMTTIATELLELVGLQGFESHYPSELSGGMRQRVNLARALAIDPDILFMDEPFAAVDAQTREVMQRELLRIWEVKRKTVVFVTHQLDEAVYLSDRVIVLGRRPGRVRDDVTIDIPRPRGLEVKRTPEFVQLVDRIWSQIEDEVVEDASA